MRFQTDPIGLTALILVLLAYVMFGSVFLFRKRPRKPKRINALPQRLSELCCKA
jgi:hypothetical protein